MSKKRRKLSSRFKSPRSAARIDSALVRTRHIHHFKIEGDQLKKWRLTVEKNDAQIGVKARILYLWTDRGAARHAKMIGTD